MGTPAVRRETPDIETASEGYARRFTGRAGAYFLEVQAAALAALVPGVAGARVLEVGGGHGQLVPGLLAAGAGSITVCGSAESCHARLRAGPGAAGLRFVTCDLLRLPFADRSQDLVLAVRLISHLEDWRGAIAEMCRVARRSVIIDYPSWRSLNALTPALFAFKRGVEGNTRRYRTFFEGELARAFRRQGFAPGAARRQFFLPMFVHRMFDSPGALRGAEGLLRRSGLTACLGSPVLARFDRDAQAHPVSDADVVPHAGGAP